MRSRVWKWALHVTAVACGAALLAGAAAHAQDTVPEQLTLPEALQRLRDANPDRIAAQLQIAAAEAERREAQLFANPTLSVDAANIPVGRTTPAGLSVGQTLVASSRVDQPLILWGKRRLRIAAADFGIAAAREQEHDALRQLTAALKGAFYRALHDERLLAFTTDNQQRYQKIVELNERRFRSGDISEVEYRKIELENLKFVTAAEEARRNLAEAQQLLGRLTGGDHAVAAAGELTGSSAAVDGPDLVAVAMQNRPDWAAAQHAREQADTALTLARRERLPDVTVGADYTHSQFVISGDNRNSIGFGFSVPVPLLNQRQGAIARAEVALRQADNDLARLRLDIAQEVHDAAERYTSAQRLRRTFESGYLEHNKLTVTAAETSYRIGAASLLELLDAERTYTETQTDYLDTVFAERASLADLEKAIGTDLSQ